jgi:hypothetical protein
MFSATHIAVLGPTDCVQNVVSPEEFSCYIVNLGFATDISHVETMCDLSRWLLMVGS